MVTAGVTPSVIEVQGSNKPQPAALSCPNEADIRPCVCSTILALDLDCSEVLDEDQLLAVFHTDFPTHAFRRFTMYQNKHLKTLRDYTFELVTFEEIWITDGVLEKVEENAFSHSAATVKSLIFNMNSISTFPFSSLSTFTELLSLDLRVNNLQWFPKITSPTLEVLYLSHNPLGGLPVDAFAGTPSIIDLHLSNTQITEILPGKQ